MATQSEIADWLGISTRRVRELESQGILPGARKDHRDIKECVSRYCHHLREVAARRKSDRPDGDAGDDLDLVAERARLAKEQADAQEMKNAISRGNLIHRQDVVVGIGSMIAHCRARLLSLPGKAAPAVFGMGSIAEINETLETHVHEALEELSSTRAVADANGDKPSDGGRSDRDDVAVEAAAAPDGERVGRSRASSKR